MCGFDEVSTKYIRGAHSCPDRGIKDRSDVAIGSSAESIARYRKSLDSVPPHLDRECGRCRYRWAEATLEGTDA